MGSPDFMSVPECNKNETIEVKPNQRYFERGIERQNGVSSDEEEDNNEVLKYKVDILDKKCKLYMEMIDKVMEKMGVMEDLMEFREREYKTKFDRMVVENFTLRRRILRVEREVL